MHGIIRKLVSGGQTGVDRAALDIALELGIQCGGWCPRGRLAEDGVIPARYPLQETESSIYEERTRLNVLDSDGTLILGMGELSGGTAYTVDVANENGKPFLIITLDESADPRKVIDWIKHTGIDVLNVAGPREDRHLLIHEQATDFLRKVLQ